jgi:hypothetical protein
METIIVKKVSVEKISFNVKRSFWGINHAFLVIFTSKSGVSIQNCPFLGRIFA